MYFIKYNIGKLNQLTMLKIKLITYLNKIILNKLIKEYFSAKK